MTLSSLWALYYLHYGIVTEIRVQGLLSTAATTASVSPTPTPLRISGPRLTYSVYPTHVPTAAVTPYTNEALEKEKEAFRRLATHLKNQMCYYYDVGTFNTIISSLPFVLTLIYIYALCLNSFNRDEETNVSQKRVKKRR